MSQHHRRHDVYDDTHHNQQFDPSNEVTIHRHQRGSSTRHHRTSVDHYDPFHDMERAFGGPFGEFDGLFGSMRNMMTSMDRMFDQVAANAPPASGGTYYYESRKMTVGPDGRVHEETVRTVPDQHGNPQTSRIIRDGDTVQEMVPSRGRIRGGRSSRQHDDVVIEEIDDHGEPIRQNRVARRSSRDERDARGRQHTHAHSTGNWLRDRYNQWRSRV